ncbi:hypothetical protein M1C59_13930 [Gordonia terrae]|uniref:hypothetical protein n=1 Tax=Gordonia terrae TaxID=2055 RepID=UPI00200B16A9|nr:hypothetical protein [Gordonia terrae]UPW07196.1 hypothetical protein M1C59_13930 [Gordonia terrae]
MVNDDAYARGFGRYLDEDMRDRPHTADEAEQERAERGQHEVDEHGTPTTRLSDRLNRATSDRGFGRYLQ